MTHLVNHLQFDLHCDSEARALGLRQQAASAVLQQQVQEMIDRVCSQYAGDDTWITIDRVEVNLGFLHPDSFSTAFAPVLLERLEKELVSKLAQASAGPQSISRRRSETELLQYLLLYGVLPWWGTAAEPDMDNICQETLGHAPEAFARFLWQQRNNQAVWQRISYQLNAASKEQVIALLPVLAGAAGYLHEWIDNVYRQSFSGQLPGTDAVRSIVQKIVLEQAPRLLQDAGVASFPTKATGKGNAPLPEADLGWLKSLLLRNEEALPIEHVPPAEMLPADTGPYPTTGDSPEKYFIKTAGIVLLASFLKPFFTTLGLMEDAAWISRLAAWRAVHLLKYLSTGLQRQPEYSLVLEKICCGLPPSEPLPVDIILEEREMQEAEQLLAAVIGHWRVLKNTSPNGLREGFLKRDGILTHKDNGWLLQVERKTLDVLLDSLPWGYGSVRLPWNNENIMVEW